MRHHRYVSVFLRLILITPTPHIVTSIPGSLHSLLYNVSGNDLQVIRESELRAAVDEGGGQIELVISELCRFVVPRENVMIIVPALAERSQCHCFVLRRIDKPVEDYFNVRLIVRRLSTISVIVKRDINLSYGLFPKR